MSETQPTTQEISKLLESQSADEALDVLNQSENFKSSQDFGGSRYEHKLVGGEWLMREDGKEWVNKTEDKIKEGGEALQEHEKIITDLKEKKFSIIVKPSSQVHAGTEKANSSYEEKIHATIYKLEGGTIAIINFEGTKKEFKDKFKEEEWMQDLMDGDDDNNSPVKAQEQKTNLSLAINSKAEKKEILKKETSAWDSFWENLVKPKNQEQEVQQQQKGFLELFGLENKSREEETGAGLYFAGPREVNLLSLFAPEQDQKIQQEANLRPESVPANQDIAAAFKAEATKPAVLEAKDKVVQPAITILEPGKRPAQSEVIEIHEQTLDTIQKQNSNSGISLAGPKVAKEPVQKEQPKARVTSELIRINTSELKIEGTEYQLTDNIDSPAETSIESQTRQSLPEKQIISLITEVKPGTEAADVKDGLISTPTTLDTKINAASEPKTQPVDTKFSPVTSSGTESLPERDDDDVIAAELKDESIVILEHKIAADVQKNNIKEITLVSTGSEVINIVLETPQTQQVRQKQNTYTKESEAYHPQIERADLIMLKVETLSQIQNQAESTKDLETLVEAVRATETQVQPMQIQLEAASTPSKTFEILQAEKLDEKDATIIIPPKARARILDTVAETVYIEQTEDNADNIEIIDEAEKPQINSLEVKAVEVPLLYKELELPVDKTPLGQTIQKALKLVIERPEAVKVLTAKDVAPKIQERQKEPIVKLREQIQALGRVLAKEITPQKTTVVKMENVKAAQGRPEAVKPLYKQPTAQNQLRQIIYKDIESITMRQTLDALANLKIPQTKTHKDAVRSKLAMHLPRPVIARSASDEAISSREKIASAFAKATADRSAALAMIQHQPSFAKKVIRPIAIHKTYRALETTMSKQGANTVTPYIADDVGLINSQNQTSAIQLTS